MMKTFKKRMFFGVVIGMVIVTVFSIVGKRWTQGEIKEVNTSIVSSPLATKQDVRGRGESQSKGKVKCTTLEISQASLIAQGVEVTKNDTITTIGKVSLINVVRHQQTPAESNLSPDSTQTFQTHKIENAVLARMRELFLLANRTYSAGNKKRNATGNNCETFTREASMSRVGFVYLFKANKDSVKVDDVTYVTQMTTDRFKAFDATLKHWDGPVSVALYVTYDQAAQLPDILKNYTTWTQRTNINMYVVPAYGEFYPVNYLRDMALQNAMTNYVFLSDVDLVPCPNAYSTLLSYVKTGILDLQCNLALVVVAFAFPKPTQEKYPESKSKLLELWDKGILGPFSIVGHYPTDFDRWKKTDIPYQVWYKDGYEPYIVTRKKVTPPYDKRFVGRWADKVSHLYEVAARGFSFVILPDIYIIHYPHSGMKQPEHQVCGQSLYYGQLKTELRKQGFVPNRP